MPRELLLEAPRRIEFRDYEEAPPGPGEVTVESRLTGIKSGTEMSAYRGTSPFATSILEPSTRLFTPRDEGSSLYPCRLGSWGVGKVTATGEGVTRFRPGDRVHGPMTHRPTQSVAASRLYPLGDLTPDAALLADPSMFALALAHDAEIKLGDRVAIFGMGAIGLLAVQAARLQGAETIIAVDRINGRLEAARRFGADELLNPAHGDPGTVVKALTSGKGVDVAIEISGSSTALHDCIRCVHVAGLVVAGAYYQGDSHGLRLGEEWHHNRPTLRSSMAVWGCPHRAHPMWSESRLIETAIRLLERRKLSIEGILTHRFPYDRAAEAYDMIDRRPEQIVKAAITY